MSNITALARPEIVALRPYAAATQAHLTIRLNANEVPWNPGSESEGQLNRYPQVRPWQLRDRLAEIYDVTPQQLLVSRGSSEAIDLLIRIFCRPGQDHIVITPPTFGMYQVYADIQNAGVCSIPLREDCDFRPDIPAILKMSNSRSKIFFICSPNNPTGASVSTADIETLLRERAEQSLVVVDEAYIEFSEMPSAIALLQRYDNLVILRTLSKAFGLAAARLGSVIAHPGVIRLLDSVMAPYAIAAPIVDQAIAMLSAEKLSLGERLIGELLIERQRLARQLSACPAVGKIWPSGGNFLLVRFLDLAAARKRLEDQRILIRDFSTEPGLHNCARITVGTTDENNLLLNALAAKSASHG